MKPSKILHSTFLIFLFSLSIAVSVLAAPSKSKMHRVGQLLTLSGDFAAAGEDCRKGVEAGIKEAGASFDPIYGDTRNSSPTAISEFRRMLDMNKVLAFYTHRSSIGMALNPISLASAVPLLGAVGHEDFASANKYAFQIWSSSAVEGRFIAEEFIRQGFSHAALIFTEDEWTNSVSNGFRKRYLELGGTLVFDQAVEPADRDLRTSLLQIKERKPDAIFMNMLLPHIVPALKQARELQINFPMYFNFYLAKSEVLEGVGKDGLEGVRFVEMETDLPKLKEALGITPNQSPPGLTVASYVATILLSQAIATNPAMSSPTELYNALLSQTEVRTADRTYPIKDRRVIFELVVKEMHEGKGASVKR